MNARVVSWIGTSEYQRDIFFRNCNLHVLLLNNGQYLNDIIQYEHFECKVVVCVLWNYNVILHYEPQVAIQTIDAELYLKQLERLYPTVWRNHTASLRSKRARL